MISQFDILAISEHSLFEEQLGIRKSATDNTYDFHAVSASDNPCIISGEKAHGGVALLWKTSFDDYITPIENIECDRIVGIKCKFPGCKPLFLLSVCMTSSNHAPDEYREYLDFLWALYDSLSVDSFALVMGDLNGNLENSLGDKGLKEPNERGKLLLDFANYFNLCPINLLTIYDGPLETYFSHYGKYRSTIDYIFLPNCLQNSIVMSKTFDLDIDNTSDHQPVIAKLDYSISDVLLGQHCPNSTTKQKIHWSNISQETVNVKYVDPLLSDISELNMPSSIEPTALTETITDLLLNNSLSLVSPLGHFATKSVSTAFILVYRMKLRTLAHCVKRHLHPGNKLNFQWSPLSMTSIEQNEGIIARLCANSLINSNVIELRNFAVLQILTRNYFGNF